jgi:hypothetical protein
VGCGFLSRWAWVAELFLKRKLSLPVDHAPWRGVKVLNLEEARS